MFKKTTFLLINCVLLAACASKRGPEVIILTPEEETRILEILTTRYDVNGDGQIRCDDLDLRRARLFESIDRNSDGFLDETEYRFAKFEDASFQFWEIVDLDKNEDFVVSLTEFQAVGDNDYARIDRDKNCTASRSEILEAGRGLVRGIRQQKKRRQQRTRFERSDDVIELEEIEDGSPPQG